MFRFIIVTSVTLFLDFDQSAQEITALGDGSRRIAGPRTVAEDSLQPLFGDVSRNRFPKGGRVYGYARPDRIGHAESLAALENVQIYYFTILKNGEVYGLVKLRAQALQMWARSLVQVGTQLRPLGQLPHLCCQAISASRLILSDVTQIRKRPQDSKS